MRAANAFASVVSVALSKWFDSHRCMSHLAPSWTRNGGRCTVTLIFMIAAVFASAAYFGRNEFQTAVRVVPEISVVLA